MIWWCIQRPHGPQVLHPTPGELRLRLLHPPSAAHRWLHLHGCWADLLAAPGDDVNVLLTPGHAWAHDAAGAAHATLTNGSEGLVVLHPDMLCSGTAIATALRCPRQAMLQEKGVGVPGKAACIGTLMHELVERALHAAPTLPDAAAPQRPLPIPRGVELQPSSAARNPAAYTMREQHTASVRAGGTQPPGRTRIILQRMLADVAPLVVASAPVLAEVGLSQREAERTLREAAGRLAVTIATHFRGGAPGNAAAALEGIVDIEESVWAPKYGVKGVIDSTVLARVVGGESGPAGGALGLGAVEFKSGKRWHSHAAQVRRGSAPHLAMCRLRRGNKQRGP